MIVCSCLGHNQVYQFSSKFCNVVQQNNDIDQSHSIDVALAKLDGIKFKKSLLTYSFYFEFSLV